MNPDLDAAMREAYASVPGDEVYYDTLEINHASFTQPIRVVRDFERFVVGPLEFLPYPFEFKLPQIVPGQVPRMIITIDNVSAEIGKALYDAVNSALDPVEVIYRQYARGDITAQYEFPVPMILQSVSLSTHQVEGVCSFPDLVNRRFPTEFYTLDRFPGLAR